MEYRDGYKHADPDDCGQWPIAPGACAIQAFHLYDRRVW
jgi:hypothetical protein